MPGSSLKVMLGCQRQRIAAHQVGPLVAVHAQPWPTRWVKCL
jgi:hypothetical protein